MKTKFLDEITMKILGTLGLSLNYQSVSGLNISTSPHYNICDGCGNLCSSDCYGGCEGACQGRCFDSCRDQSY